ncbi:hypothetical protein Ahy_B01g057116 [Arachis hypogaea]|uniref:Uncharacterized protein n=1 Tax=Arachis hypogaea TaxID=3818 RepID=A0A445B0B5_ARAHY|nr:hypothetical protein Ahy_B01g057116 [Arachis hypogaea]
MHSDVLEHLHFRILPTVHDNLVLILDRFDHRAMKDGWLHQVTWVTLELLQHAEHWDCNEAADVYSEDEDYDPEADEVESFDDHVDNLFATQEPEHQGNANNCEDTDYWEVDVIKYGMTKQMNLTVKEAIKLPPSRKIVLQHKTKLQAVGQAASLFSGFLGSLGEAIAHIESQAESSKELSQNDSLAQKEIAKLKAETAEDKAKRQTMESLLRYLIQQQGDNLSPDIAVDLDSLESAPTLSYARSSSGNHDLHDKS